MGISIEDILQRGIEAHRTGELQKADELYKTILNAYPDHPDANHNMGVLVSSLERPERALPFFERALNTYPEREHYWLSYLAALVDSNQVSKAKSALNDARARGILGAGFENLGRRIDQLVLKEPASVIQDPRQEDMKPLVDLYKRGKLAECLNLAEELLRQFPFSSALHNLRGAALFGLQEFDRAIDSYKQAIEIQPRLAAAHNNLGNVYKANNNLKSAINSYQRAIKIDAKNARAHSNLGVALQAEGDFDKAINCFRSALKIEEDNPDFYFNIGHALTQKGDLQQAIGCFTRSIELNPGKNKSYFNLASIFYKLGDYHSAEKNLAIANVQYPGKITAQAAIKLVNKQFSVNQIQGGQSYKNSPNQVLLSRGIFYKTNRDVEEELLGSLCAIHTRALDDAPDARYGHGRCSDDFSLFDAQIPIIQKVSVGLVEIMEECTGCEIIITDSFFNILREGGGSKPHNHLQAQDEFFCLKDCKYSLVYYVSIGDQDCDQPGILKLYEPDYNFLPDEGTIIIIPASRYHSAIYSGLSDRVMIGVNFYAV